MLLVVLPVRLEQAASEDSFRLHRTAFAQIFNLVPASRQALKMGVLRRHQAGQAGLIVRKRLPDCCFSENLGSVARAFQPALVCPSSLLYNSASRIPTCFFFPTRGHSNCAHASSAFHLSILSQRLCRRSEPVVQAYQARCALSLPGRPQTSRAPHRTSCWPDCRSMHRANSGCVAPMPLP